MNTEYSMDLVVLIFTLIVLLSYGVLETYAKSKGRSILDVLKIYFTSIGRRNRAVTTANTSVLVSYYAEGANLINLTSGKLKNGLNYTILITDSGINDEEDLIASMICKVSLPFSTTIHLLGIPRNTNATLLNPAQRNSIMEKVNLEGNYNDIFDLYTEKGMQSDARYVLDPKAMVFTIDFCQSQNWELVGNELHFVVASNMKLDPNDETGVLHDAEKFIEQIRPAVERPLTQNDLKLMSPYGKDYRTDLKCPLCSEVMVNEESYYHCPQNHGVLLSGGQLHLLSKGNLKIHLKSNNPVDHTDLLVCPSCGSDMTSVNYLGGNIVIDSCTKCSYRWLDAGEYTKN